jgi:hypothetical protein
MKSRGRGAQHRADRRRRVLGFILGSSSVSSHSMALAEPVDRLAGQRDSPTVFRTRAQMLPAVPPMMVPTLKVAAAA